MSSVNKTEIIDRIPISEKEISQLVGRTIKSPVRLARLRDLGLDEDGFLAEHASIFEELSWDNYDVRRERLEILEEAFPRETTALRELFPRYYLGEEDESIYSDWTNRLNDEQRNRFDQVEPWRRRSVATFVADEDSILREPPSGFSQAVDESDIRSLPRVFDESPDAHVENKHFQSWLRAVYDLVCEVRPEASKLRVSAHFMSIRASHGSPGENSPEGAHEDGADYIISALVVNRINVTGGESQIIEKILPQGNKELIYHHALQPGEFAFQSDTRDEFIHGTDLWHHVTPIRTADPALGEGWRELIGFDINVIE